MADCPAEAKRADFYVYSLPEQVRDIILEEMKTKDAAQAVLDEIRKIYKTSIDSFWNVYENVQKAKDYIHQYIKDNEVNPEQKVVVLCHKHSCMSWVYKVDDSYSKTDEFPYPYHIPHFDNCEIRSELNHNY